VYSLDLNNSPRIGLTPGKSCVKNYDATNRGALDVKWWVLEFSLLPSSALKCVPRNAKGLRQSRGLWHSAKNLERNRSICGIPRSNFTKELAFRSILASGGWHSAVHLRAVCQDVIPIVAIRGQRTAELGK
jgi:hypothetical protein